jgi:HSP20 family protein
MQLMRRQWDPFKELEALTDRFNKMFGYNGGTDNKEPLSLTTWAPSCDVSENAAGYKVRAELPDVKKDDIKVTLDGGVLTPQGERKQEKEEKDTKVHRREMFYGSFMRSFTLPDDADEAAVTATFKDGILEVTVGKSKAKAAKTKEIAVKTA